MKEFNFIPQKPNAVSFKCTGKFRYRQPEQGVTVTFIEKTQEGYTIRVDFDEPQRAITEGQYCVLYDGEKCIGGGVIEGVIF